jgi:hypothetical protein
VARSDSGALTAAARAAARRPHPAERRAKTLATLAAIGRARPTAAASGPRADGSDRRRGGLDGSFYGFAAYLRQPG